MWKSNCYVCLATVFFALSVYAAAPVAAQSTRVPFGILVIRTTETLQLTVTDDKQLKFGKTLKPRVWPWTVEPIGREKYIIGSEHGYLRVNPKDQAKLELTPDPNKATRWELFVVQVYRISFATENETGDQFFLSDQATITTVPYVFTWDYLSI